MQLQLTVSLPDWLAEVTEPGRSYPSDDDKVGLAIALSRLNLEHASGGPFGAAVFDDAHRLIAAGVNRVVNENCSVAHAEIMAYVAAQQALGRFRLNENGQSYVLATSAQPCCQCYGATVWAGVDTLLIGARSEDVEALTEFDEGPLPADWIGELERRGITVRRDILREQAREVLAHYGAHGPHY
jgi:tRNA(Arg) A34 adenosine deaminase TadA